MVNKLNWKLLKKLLDEIGIPGQEDFIQNIIEDNYDKKNYEAFKTPLNNVVLKSTSKKKRRIAICSHSDEVGLFIRKIEENGRAVVIPFGGLFVHSLYGALLSFKTVKGKEIQGTLVPPSSKEIRGITNVRARRRRLGLESTSGVIYNAIFSKKHHLVDFGFVSKKEAEKAGIRVGCQGTFATKAKKIANNKVLAKATDNRVGTYINLVTSEDFFENKTYAIDRIFGVREEIGATAITTAFENTNYDAAIVLDVSPSREDVGLGIVGKGPLKRILDATHITNSKILKNIEKTAKKHKIKIQDFVSLGGTDGGMINLTKMGIPIIPLNICSRYIHTGTSICDIEDIIQAKKLLKAICLEIKPSWFKK